MLDWNEIKLILEISRCGSFAAAATALSVHPASIGRRVTALESAAGTQLFRRLPAGAKLTLAGERLLVKALKVEAEVLDFEVAFKKLRCDPAQYVVIQASEGVSSYLLAPLVAGQRLGPLGLVMHQVGRTLPPLRFTAPASTDAADIRIVWTSPENQPPGHPDERMCKLADIQFIPFHSDRYRSDQAVDKLDDLQGHKLISLRNYDWFQTEGSMAPWHRLVNSTRLGTIITDWSSSMAHLTLDGAGIGLLPTYSSLYLEGLRPLNIKGPKITSRLWMLASNDNLRDPTISGCYRTLQKLFAAYSW